MSSETEVVDVDLLKLRCRRCGLVRDGNSYTATVLAQHYEKYRLAVSAARAEPLFFTEDRAIPRSEMVAHWIRDAARRARPGWQPTALAEIGAGEGRLLERLALGWPQASVIGVDLSPEACALATDRGLDVRIGDLDALPANLDLVVAVAVLEHVPDPRAFLGGIRQHLSDDGIAVLAQPCLDRPAVELFFSDHLHHFRAAHVGALAAQAGLREEVRDVGQRVIRDFSLHVLTAGPARVPGPEELMESSEGLTAAIAGWHSRFAALDGWLSAPPAEPLAVWGLGQSFVLLRAYTALDRSNTVAGIDDNPARFDAETLGFPVTTPEGALARGARRILLTFPPGPSVLERLTGLEVDYHRAF